MNSNAGIWTRVLRVKAVYPNQLDYVGVGSRGVGWVVVVWPDHFLLFFSFSIEWWWCCRRWQISYVTNEKNKCACRESKPSRLLGRQISCHWTTSARVVVNVLFFFIIHWKTSQKQKFQFHPHPEEQSISLPYSTSTKPIHSPIKITTFPNHPDARWYVPFKEIHNNNIRTFYSTLLTSDHTTAKSFQQEQIANNISRFVHFVLDPSSQITPLPHRHLCGVVSVVCDCGVCVERSFESQQEKEWIPTPGFELGSCGWKPHILTN